MRPYLAFLRTEIALLLRDRVILFFNYLFPLVLFFGTAAIMDPAPGYRISLVVTAVLVVGVLGNGLYNAGMRIVLQREMSILRRFKVAPMSAAPMLVSSIITGWLIYLPTVAAILLLAHFLYGMPFPERPVALFVLLSLALMAFRALGLIVASVVNSPQETTMTIQLIYLPMLVLSGATVPVVALPAWAQAVTPFLPASYLVSGLQGLLLRRESLADNVWALVTLALTLLICTVLSVKLFRWEKGEKIGRAAKLWALVALSPFLLLGVYQSARGEQLRRAEAFWRQLHRNEILLIQGARVVVGDGRVLPEGSVLVRNGRIEGVFPGRGPDPGALKAQVVPGAGKTVLPGLIDGWVHLGATGVPGRPATAEASLAAALYSGVTAVYGPAMDGRLAAAVERGELLGAEPLTARLEVVTAGPAGIPVPANSGRVTVVEDGGNLLSDDFLAGMARTGAAYLPRLSGPALELAARQGRDPFASSLLEQVAPVGLLAAARKALSPASPGRSAELRALLALRQENLRRAFRHGVPLLAGSGAGMAPVLHGPAVARELALWVEAGIPPGAALAAATGGAARLLGAAGRMGILAPGREADLVVVEGDPLRAIGDLERVVVVIAKGEKIDRSELLFASGRR
jgi:imidazolonepropionase-like amidohydrolase